MSPLSTFQSWGSSSRLSLRSTRADPRDPRVALDLERRAGELVEVRERGLARLGVDHHRAELVEPEQPATETTAVLAKNTGPDPRV